MLQFITTNIQFNVTYCINFENAILPNIFLEGN